jgi:hypothetical protein
MSGPLVLSPDLPLARPEPRALGAFLREVLRLPDARLRHLVLFGSRARGDHGADSDLDLLLLFDALAPDREPHATWVERIAEAVARRSGVPLQPWSVSLADLERGRRTPMLVDALADGISLWPPGLPHPRVPFTLPDAAHCAGALLERTSEGSAEVRRARARGEGERAALRARDDLVRLAVAWTLLHGETRPRRGAAARRALALGADLDAALRRQLEWAARSFGESGKEEDRLISPPPDGVEALCAAVERLRRAVAGRGAALPARSGGRRRTGTALAPAPTRTRHDEGR